MEHNDHSYELTDEFFDAICDRISFPLKVDCFASRLNFKLQRYFSRYSDPYSSCVDAFSASWSDHVYLFPPVPIVDCVISKFRSDNTGHGLLICPYWPSQHWFPSLLDLLIAPPLLIPLGAVVDENRRLPRSCQLVAWIIGSNPALLEGYLGRLGSVGSRGLLGRRSSRTRGVGQNLVVGTINGLQVTVELL